MNLTIKEKAKGAIFAYAIGDALGLGTEFMTVREIKRRYPSGLTDYSQIIRDAHRSQWERGSYTNDTIIISLLIESMCDKGRIDPIDFAGRLSEWYHSIPIDLTTNMRWVISRETFASDPFKTAEEVWQKMNINEIPSDGLGRALFVGMWNEDVSKNAIDTCMITHPSIRCATCAKIIATMANSLMWKDEPAGYDELAEIAEAGEKDIIRYLEMARHGIISDFRLDHEDTYWFVRKAMGAALWCVWHCKSVEEALLAVVNAGGDADTNASLAAGLTALRFGFDSIPAKYVDNLVGKAGLETLSERFSETLQKRFG